MFVPMNWGWIVFAVKGRWALKSSLPEDIKPWLRELVVGRACLGAEGRAPLDCWLVPLPNKDLFRSNISSFERWWLSNRFKLLVGGVSSRANSSRGSSSTIRRLADHRGSFAVFGRWVGFVLSIPFFVSMSSRMSSSKSSSGSLALLSPPRLPCRPLPPENWDLESFWGTPQPSSSSFWFELTNAPYEFYFDTES